jgi:hypothetical protein
MADLTATSAQVGDASPDFSVRLSYIAAEAISKSEGVYINSSGKAALADASAAGTAVCRGIAISDAGAGQVVEVLAFGYLTGYDLSSVAYDTILSVSDTAGAIDNGAGSPTVAAPIGRVTPLSDGALTKVVFVNCLYNLVVLPA